MKEKIKAWLIKNSKAVITLALAVLIFDVNSTCSLVCHQPEMPDGCEKFKR